MRNILRNHKKTPKQDDDKAGIFAPDDRYGRPTGRHTPDVGRQPVKTQDSGLWSTRHAGGSYVPGFYRFFTAALMISVAAFWAAVSIPGWTS